MVLASMVVKRRFFLFPIFQTVYGKKESADWRLLMWATR